ncbi:MAG: TorD/DmsD family molecular chaperone [bacterium]
MSGTNEHDSSDASRYDDASSEDRLRAEVYSTLAGLFSAPPSPATLDYLQHSSFASGDGAPADSMAAAWRRVRESAAETTPNALDDEYHALFIGLGRGEVVPYGSWHLTGFLMEKPLSDLRDDLSAFGIERDSRQKDPEDHIAALCEAMALIIVDGDIAESGQRRFFARHIDSWADRFFAQLQSAGSARFYRAVGVFGARFLALERDFLSAESSSSSLSSRSPDPISPTGSDALASTRSMH